MKTIAWWRTYFRNRMRMLVFFKHVGAWLKHITIPLDQKLTAQSLYFCRCFGWSVSSWKYRSALPDGELRSRAVRHWCKELYHQHQAAFQIQQKVGNEWTLGLLYINFYFRSLMKTLTDKTITCVLSHPTPLRTWRPRSKTGKVLFLSRLRLIYAGKQLEDGRTSIRRPPFIWSRLRGDI